MIAKGTAHNNGAKLARYITTGKDGERAELWQLSGFSAGDIRDAFRDVHVMAEGTRAQNPFFHVQVRNPDGEELTRAQWEHVANRIEEKLGLTGQPRAIAFHTNEVTGHEHMHVAFSRIDQDTLKAIPLPFFKLRLKEVSRELEIELGLTRVRNEAERTIFHAPTRAEEEQARRLGVDGNEVRNTIRDCFDRSDCGRSFEAALADKGLILAQGERRDFIAIDAQGGTHALGKRILGVSASQIRHRLSDLDREHLPTEAQVRLHLVEGQLERQHEVPQIMPDRDREEQKWFDALSNAAIEKEKTERQFVEPSRSRQARAGSREEKQWPIMPDRDLEEQKWFDALSKAAIEKEKTEREFVEPSPSRQPRAGSREEKHWPIMPPQPESASWALFQNAAGEATRDDRTQNLRGQAAQVYKLWRESDPYLGARIENALEGASLYGAASLETSPDRKTFAAALDEKGILFAKVTKDEADRSHREAEFAKAVGNHSPRFKEGEIVIVTEPRTEYRREGETVEPARVHKLNQSLAEKFLRTLDNKDQLQGINATKENSDARAKTRADDRQILREEYATRINDWPLNRAVPREIIPAPIKNAVIKMPAAALDAIAKPLDVFANLFEGLIAPKLTPQQVRQGEIATERREAEAESGIDFRKFMAEMSQQRQQQENQQEAERRRQREVDRDR